MLTSRKGESHISTTQVYRILVSAADMLGCNDTATHTIRKTFGYHYCKHGYDILTLMNIINHSDRSITKCYIGITENEVVDTLKNF